MVQRLPAGYVFDPEDPRAPAVEQWERMLPDERARVLAMLDGVAPEQKKAQQLAGKLAEAERLREEERAEAQRQLAEARAEIERLKKGAP
jgi:uncharacterized protein YlxW (UPF0749 family)